jgi:hypothetical protein
MRKILLVSSLFLSIFAFGQKTKPMSKLTGTTWINNLFENCTDTLKVTSNSEMIFYSCEHDIFRKANYSVKSDTIFVDLYDYIDNETIGLYSKYKMKISENKLEYIFIGHLYGGKYPEIDKKYYKTAGEFMILK